MESDLDTRVDFDRYLDTQGLLCPEPLMLLHQAVNDLAPGQVLKLEATDPSATRDVEKFCCYLGHELLRVNQQSEVLVFWVRKGAS